MAKREQWHLHEENESSALNKEEVTSIFVDTLIDIYTAKSQLLKYLPTMAGNATATALKLAILDNSIDIKTQLLRLDMVLVMIGKDLNLKHRKSYNDFNFTGYLRSGSDQADLYRTDIAMLTFLILIESIQVTIFTMMKKMAHAFNSREVVDLIKNNLNDAIENKLIFDAMMNDCLAKPA